MTTDVAAATTSPEPKVLIFADDPEKKPRLYACASCGTVHSPLIYLAREEVQHATAKEAARNCYSCRTHNTCSHCGEPCDKSYTACPPCRDKRRLEAAVEVPDDGGPYCELGGDTFYFDMESAQDAGLEWVSPCTVTYPHIDPDSALENLIEDMFEDASEDDLAGVSELVAAINAFNKAQTTPTYWGDDKRKIRVPRRDTDGSPKGRDAQRLDGEAATAGAEGIAQNQSESSS